MLYIDALRGEDSTGAYVITKKWDAHWAKQASLPQTFLNNTQATSLLNKIGYDGLVVVGHNRKATFGKVTDENAHPFVEDKVILVHNGTLRNHKELNKEVAVDSHAIAHAIKEHGVRKAIKKINGAFAVAAADVEKEQFYLFRNDERPLFIAEIDDAWMFASEAWMVYGVASREGCKVTNMRQLEAGQLYTFALDDKKNMSLAQSKVRLWAAPDKPKVVAKPPAPVVVQKTLPLAPKGGNDVLDIIERFPKDKIVCFRPEKLFHLHNHKFKISGQAVADSSLAIEAFVEGKSEDLLPYLEKEVLFGYVRSLSADTALGNARIYLHQVGISDPVNTKGDPINEEDMAMLSGQCHACGGLIDDDDVSNSFFRKRGRKHIMMCPTCYSRKIEENPHFGVAK